MTEPFRWSRARTRIGIHEQPLDRALHLIREAWREHLFHQFTQANRRDARHLRDWQYDESIYKQARELYQRGDSSAKAVMIGAAHSTAFYQKRKFDIVQAECQGIPNSQMRPARPASIGAGPAARLAGQPGQDDVGECPPMAWVCT